MLPQLAVDMNIYLSINTWTGIQVNILSLLVIKSKISRPRSSFAVDCQETKMRRNSPATLLCTALQYPCSPLTRQMHSEIKKTIHPWNLRDDREKELMKRSESPRACAIGTNHSRKQSVKRWMNVSVELLTWQACKKLSGCVHSLQLTCVAFTWTFCVTLSAFSSVFISHVYYDCGGVYVCVLYILAPILWPKCQCPSV